MLNEGRARRLTTLQWVLILGGVVCLGWCALVVIGAWRYQSRTAPPHVVSTPPSSAADSEGGAPAAPALPTALPVGEPIGRIEVPRLHLSAAMANGDDDGTLRLAIGHLPDTPFPWENGNSALAGHRDTFFRELRHIRVNDDMRLETPYGDFTYRVTKTLIVKPDDLSVLAPTTEPTLTLVTCYPFSYVGHAPKRFIVEAVRSAAVPAATN
jgi:sortase A